MRQRLGRRLAMASERPLFAWLHLMEPHKPYRRHPDLPPEEVLDSVPERSETDRLYRDEVRHALRETIAIIELLRRRGLWDDTVFVLVSDHGEMLRSDGRGQGPGRRFVPQGHGHALYEELVRVPLVVRAAGGAETTNRVDTLVSHVDVAAMVLRLAGLDSWSGVDPASRPKDSVLSSTETQLEQQALRTERWKLIHFPGGRHPDEIYDLSLDPGERRNLAPTRSRLRARLRRNLADAMERLAAAEDGELLELDDEDRARLRALGYIE